MNKKGVENLRTIAHNLEDSKSDIEAIYNEEEDKLGNISENLQGSTMYERIESACDNLSEAIDYLESAIDSIETVIDS